MNRFDRKPDYDYILVGGGLQAGLLSLALEYYQPNARVLMIERSDKIAGNHTWSFHLGDVDEESREWVWPLIERQWCGYDVRITRSVRHVQLQYASISSEHFARVVQEQFSPALIQHTTSTGKVSQPLAVGTGALATGEAWEPQFEIDDRGPSESNRVLITNAEVSEVSADRVVTRTGDVFSGRVVVDCRGPSSANHSRDCGYQKFFGFEVNLTDDWQSQRPVVMESIADQRDGFRFLYTLPFEPRRILIEDTRFSDSPEMNRADCLAVVTQYLRENGHEDFTIIREESGVLPMPFRDELRPEKRCPLAGGYAGGWFHAATGYSFPLSVAFAQTVAAGPKETIDERVRQLADRHRWRASYARFLNRLLFRLVAPQQRQHIFRRFYRVLTAQAVERFYAHRFTAGDAFRIVVGIPPTLIGLRPIRFFRSFFFGANQ